MIFNFVDRLFFFILFLFSITIFSQKGIRFENASFDEILKKAGNEEKLVFVDAYASWCGPCIQMKKNVFSLESVGNYYNENFINARFDVEKGEGKEMAKRYNIRAFPTYLFFDSSGDILLRSTGYTEKEEFIELGKQAAETKKTYVSQRERFVEGDKDPKFLINLFFQVAEGNPSFAKEVSERYFKVREEKITDPKELSMLLYHLRSSQDPGYKIFEKNKETISGIVSFSEYEKLDLGFKLNPVLEKLMDGEKELNEEKFMNQAKKIVPKEKAEEFLNRYRVLYYPSQRKYKAYAKAAIKYYKDGSVVPQKELLLAAFIFSEYVKDPHALKQALEWAEKLHMKSEDPETSYVLAKLYFLNGKDTQAKMFAEKSIDLLNKRGADISFPQKLLDEINRKKKK
ncbi:MAG: thioredoxin family protein [Bergeyella sp.]|nr:thioredoxin family protein [Bergeyella sp.]